MTVWAIVPAAGIGQRMGADIPKQYLQLAGKPVLQHSLEKLLKLPAIATVVVALHPDDSHFTALDIDRSAVESAPGGRQRQDSVLNGLLHLQGRAQDEDWVLVHDAVRPCVQIKDIEKLLGALELNEVGGLLAAPQDNTLKRADSENRVETTVDRDGLWQALTPQAFRYGVLKRALLNAQANELPVTDEASAVEALGLQPLLVEGDRNNVKITREADLHLAELIMQTEESQ